MDSNLIYFTCKVLHNLSKLELWTGNMDLIYMSSMSFIWWMSGDQNHNTITANAEIKACPQIQKFAATSWLDLTQTVGSF